MPGRTPNKAFVAFRDPLQDAFAVIADGPILSYPTPGKKNFRGLLCVLHLGPKDEYVSLKRVSGSTSPRLKFKGKIYYEVIRIKRTKVGSYKVCTRGYDYSIKTDNDEDVCDFHWHPESESVWTDPHLHLGTPQLAGDAVISKGQHWPSGRVTFEGIVRQLVTELDVHPRFENWKERLAKSENPHLEHRTWGGNRRPSGMCEPV